MGKSISEKNVDRICYVVLTVCGIISILPIINVFATAFSGAQAVESGRVGLWPVDFTWESFKLLIEGTMAVRAMGNSIVITVGGTVICMVMTTLAAYPLSKPYFIGNLIFTRLIVFTMLFSGGMIPTYIVIQKMGLIDTYWALWLPSAVSTYNMLVMRTFFTNIPKEIEEAAIIDGCGEWGLLLRIFIPLSKPVMATMVLFYGVAHWNTFMNAMLYINDPIKQNLSVLVQQMIKSMNVLTSELANANPQDLQAITSAGLRAAGVVVMVVPMLVIYPFLQKYFVKGVMLGSVKG